SYLDKIYLAERIHQEHTGSYAPSFMDLIPNWNGLSELSQGLSPLVVQEFQLDPTFGFHAEVAQRRSVDREPGQSRGESDLKSWSVNGYGQISEISSMVTLV